MKRLQLTLFIALLCVQHICAQEFLHVGNEVIPVSNVKRITQKVEVHPGSLSLLLEKDSKISIYVAALQATGMIDSLKFFVDDSYSIQEELVSFQNWYLAFSKERWFNFTVFACPDSILSEKYNINDLDGLRAKAKELYADAYPEDAQVTDETDRRNYLNRFISYQMLNFLGEYHKLTAYDSGMNLGVPMLERGFSLDDWYETMMPHSIIKFSTRASNRELCINFSDRVGISGTTVLPPFKGPRNSNAVNGIYHYIDDIVAYDRNTQELVFNERLRFDFTTLSPDFMTARSDGESARGRSYNGTIIAAFKPGYVRNFKFHEIYALCVWPRNLSWGLYQADDICLLGNYDVTLKLPPVPAGRYEVRIGYKLISRYHFSSVYIDGNPVDIVDFRVTSDLILRDDYLQDLESIENYDRSLRNKGYMKAPCYYSFVGPGNEQSMRDSQSIRKIIGTFFTDGKSDHYLRIKKLSESAGDDSELSLDYIELVPASVYNNEAELEDKY